MENTRKYPYRSMFHLTLLFTAIAMIITFFLNRPAAYTTEEIHAYEALADTLITQGAIYLDFSSNIEAASLTDSPTEKTSQPLYYNSIEITPTNDNKLLLTIVNDKKGDIKFEFDNTYSTPVATIDSTKYWGSCFVLTFIITPILGIFGFFVLILFSYEFYYCKKNNIPIF